MQLKEKKICAHKLEVEKMLIRMLRRIYQNHQNTRRTYDVKRK